MQGLVAGLTLSERFHLIRQLGVGGMGEIWLADDRQLGEPVAIKVLSPTLGDSEGFISLLRDECRRARGLVHPNIVRVHDFHADDNWSFISMQFVDGETLSAWRGRPFQEVVHGLLMVCDALEYAHRSGIIHRDLKSSNILVDDNGICYLTDFGIASALPGREQSPVIRGGGSLPSMSPQQLAGEPASIGDDIYSLGALFYELLSGQPLFHPDVTEERIRSERPAELQIDGSEQEIPEPLGKLVQAMLEKSAERRPAGVGAVRSVLEEVRADFPRPDDQGEAATERSAADRELIQPVRRRRSHGPDLSVEPGVATRPASAKRKKGLPAGLVYGGLATLLLVAVGVIFLLPAIVKERGPIVVDRNVEPAGPDATQELGDGADPAASEAQRNIADEVLSELLEIDDRLKSIGVALWGGSDWAEARRAVDSGDVAYRGRDYAAAAENYRRAVTLMKLLEPQAETVLATAMREGQAAFDIGDQMRAIQNFELALAIDASNSTAFKKLERARRLDQVVELMNRAAALEESGDLGNARSVYQQVLTLDALWQPASDAIARISSGIARGEYETRMAAGFSAMAKENFSQARAAFAAALAVRPGDTEASSALRQLDAEEQMLEITSLQNAAKADERQENWAAAVQKYSAIMAINSQLTEIQQDHARSKQRLELHEKLLYEIEHPERFNEDKVWNAANQLLDRARTISDPGDILSAQMAQLDQLLRIASIPVPVNFRSDNMTDVVIFKVGRLGTFLDRTVDLKPGAYVAVGTRNGYRDVRQSFTVEPSGNMQPIVLSCEDTI